MPSNGSFKKAAIICGIAVLILVLALWIIFGTGLLKQDDEPCVGMTRSDFAERFPNAFSYIDYSFYEKSNGDGVVVHFGSTNHAVDDVRIYSATSIDNSEESFSKIEEGMSVYEVVSLVGVPYRTNTSGMITMVFATDKGKEYSVYFYKSDSDDLLVSSVMELE